MKTPFDETDKNDEENQSLTESLLFQHSLPELQSKSKVGVEVWVDNREKAPFASQFEKDSVIFSTLPVGDIVFFKNGVLQLVLEKKTVSDLNSSIIDGRYVEQKMRMLAAVRDRRQIMYVIEGYDANTAPKKVTSAIFHTLVRDGCMVHLSSSMSCTYRHVMLIRETLEKFCFFFDSENIQQALSQASQVPSLNDYLTSVKIEKKKNITLETCFIRQLMCIPGVSFNIAKEIAKTFPTISLLLKAISQEGAQCLHSINVSYDKDKKKVSSSASPQKSIRKVGKKRAKRIVQFLLQKNEDE